MRLDHAALGRFLADLAVKVACKNIATNQHHLVGLKLIFVVCVLGDITSIASTSIDLICEEASIGNFD